MRPTAADLVFTRKIGAKPQAEYELPVSSFSIDAKNDHQAMDGSGLTRGNLLRLSQAVMLGRQWLPALWPQAFHHGLRSAGHLDLVTELLWLKHWRGLVTGQRGPKPRSNAPGRRLASSNP